MFPVSFADAVIREYTRPHDVVLDPFAGRGTAVFSAAASGRHGIGVELNPVGWVYGKTKLSPAPYRAVEKRLQAVDALKDSYADRAKTLPEFFAHCYSKDVREFLLSARGNLNWRTNRVDRTCMAILLVYLHGKRDASLSNQMMQTKAMSPDYALEWWKKRSLEPPVLDPMVFLRNRLKWRYAKGVVSSEESEMYLDDSVARLPIVRRSMERSLTRVSLLLTSPPYYNVTNYHYDQWLRLWLLGGAPLPKSLQEENRGKFSHQENYRALLKKVFSKAAAMMKKDGVIYVRTDRRPFTYKTTVETLVEVFPKKKLYQKMVPPSTRSQTDLFNKTIQQLGEVDLILVAT